MKRKDMLEEAVRKFVVPDGANVCYGDGFYYRSIVDRFGQEVVDKEIERQEKIYGKGMGYF